MKKKFIFLPIIGLFAYLLTTSYASGPAGLGLERTGATGTIGCTTGGCHGSSTGIVVAMNLMSGSSTVTSYTPGSSYTLRIVGTYGASSTSTSLPKFGFQVSAVKAAATSTNAGTMSAPSGTYHLTTASGISIVEHTSALNATTGGGAPGSTYVVDIPWTAPATGTGSVKFFGVINAVNGTGSADAADRWANGSVTVTEAASTTVAPITGTFTVCVGATSTLADATAGGAWSSSATGIATISSGGVLSGITAGTAIISYNAGSAGTATQVVTVYPNPAAIAGTTTLCAGTTSTLSSATSGGSWSSSATSVATVNSAGVVTGIGAGAATITYTLPTGCFTIAAINITPGLPAITGTDTLCTGTTTTLANATAGGTWSSGTATIATVDATTGIVSGIAAGTATITYSGSGGCYVTKVVTVSTATAGVISGPITVCVGKHITLSSTVAGGTWVSTNITKATVGATTGIVTGVAVGADTIKYTATNFCGTATTVYPITVQPASACPVGVGVVTDPVYGLQVAPNPAWQGTFSITVATASDDNTHITVFDLVGKQIAERDARTNTTINMKLNVAPGIYIIRATAAGEQYTTRLVIE